MMPPTPKRQPLRLVIQWIREGCSGRSSSYRLVVYGDGRTYRPLNFDSLDDLFKLLKAAVPEVNVSSIPRDTQSAATILFAEDVEVSEEQLSILGLKD